jgi:hypothetical protein
MLKLSSTTNMAVHESLNFPSLVPVTYLLCEMLLSSYAVDMCTAIVLLWSTLKIISLLA